MDVRVAAGKEKEKEKGTKEKEKGTKEKEKGKKRGQRPFYIRKGD